MKPKENEFCELFCLTANPREAAFRAGYKLFPEKKALQLLRSSAVRKRIEELKAEQTGAKEDFKTGLRRIAFGSVADAVKLMLAENVTEQEIEGLDLFNVAEIKRPKGGGMEIKFFDRFKALERLSQLEQSSDAAAFSPFYQALKTGAEALKKDDENGI